MSLFNIFGIYAGCWPKKNLSELLIAAAEALIVSRVTATSEDSISFAASHAPSARRISASLWASDLKISASESAFALTSKALAENDYKKGSHVISEEGKQ